MAEDVSVIIQVPAGSLVDRQLREDPPPSVTSGRAVTEQVPADAEGRIVPPEGGNVVLSFLSPESLRREAEQVRREVREADSDKPPVVVLEVAEELREDELAVVLQAADLARRTVLLCILLGSS
jgi:Asp-tRNA(Asn)/Glu-tRNA(Gln) amidotransferase C subunit